MSNVAPIASSTVTGEAHEIRAAMSKPTVFCDRTTVVRSARLDSGYGNGAAKLLGSRDDLLKPIAPA